MRAEGTRERIVLENHECSTSDYVISLMHTASYAFAEAFTRGKRVLDYGCGSGYGAARIAETAGEVHAVDVSEDAIMYARQHFERVNLKFQSIDGAGSLPFPNRAFETILSFQVFEHLYDTSHYLGEVRRLLAPDGCLLLITPNRRARLLPMQKPWNKWHVREYSERTLRRELSRYFNHVEIQQMSGRLDVVGIELRRCRRLKWLTLPATLPLIPEAFRHLLLNGLQAMRPRNQTLIDRKVFSFDESAIEIGPTLKPSLNLVAIARPAFPHTQRNSEV